MTCPECEREFCTTDQLNGHIGGGHRKPPVALKAIDHGSTQGYRAHKRRGEKPCPPCKAAWRRYVAARRGRT